MTDREVNVFTSVPATLDPDLLNILTAATALFGSSTATDEQKFRLLDLQRGLWSVQAQRDCCRSTTGYQQALIAAAEGQLAIMREVNERDKVPVEHPTPLERVAASVEAIAAKVGTAPSPAPSPAPAPPPPPDPPAPPPPPPSGYDDALARALLIRIAPVATGTQAIIARVQDALAALDHLRAAAGSVPPPVDPVR